MLGLAHKETSYASSHTSSCFPTMSLSLPPSQPLRQSRDCTRPQPPPRSHRRASSSHRRARLRACWGIRALHLTSLVLVRAHLPPHAFLRLKSTKSAGKLAYFQPWTLYPGNSLNREFHIRVHRCPSSLRQRKEERVKRTVYQQTHSAGRCISRCAALSRPADSTRSRAGLRGWPRLGLRRVLLKPNPAQAHPISCIGGETSRCWRHPPTHRAHLCGWAAHCEVVCCALPSAQWMLRQEREKRVPAGSGLEVWREARTFSDVWLLLFVCANVMGWNNRHVAVSPRGVETTHAIQHRRGGDAQVAKYFSPTGRAHLSDRDGHELTDGRPPVRSHSDLLRAMRPGLAGHL